MPLNKKKKKNKKTKKYKKKSGTVTKKQFDKSRLELKNMIDDGSPRLLPDWPDISPSPSENIDLHKKIKELEGEIKKLYEFKDSVETAIKKSLANADRMGDGFEVRFAKANF